MAKRSTGSTPLGGSAASGSSRKRAAPTKVSKPFPWGVALGSVVLAAALIGIVVYAVLNAGSAAPNPIKDADEKFPGLQVTELDDLKRDHVSGTVQYASVPPVGGEHNATAQQCGVYTEQIPTENAVHSLEHGAVWVTYQPDLPADQVETLTEAVEGNPYGLLSPVPDQESPIMLTAWGRQLAVDTADDDRIEEFVDTYVSGPQTPERGAACLGSTATGTTPAG